MLQKFITYVCVSFLLVSCKLDAMNCVHSKDLTAPIVDALSKVYKAHSPINLFIKIRQEFLEKDMNMEFQEKTRELLKEKGLLYINSHGDDITYLDDDVIYEDGPNFYDKLEKKKVKLRQQIKNLQKKSNGLQQKIAVGFSSGLNFETLLNNYKYVAPLRAQLFRLKVFHTTLKLIRQKKEKNEPPLLTGNYKLPPLVYRNCRKEKFQKNITMEACTDKLGIYFPPEIFTDKNLNPQQKKKISHEVCHHALNNFSKNIDEMEFETEELNILVLNTLKEVAALRSIAEQWFVALIMNSGTSLPYCLGMINALSQLKFKKTNGRDVFLKILKKNEPGWSNWNILKKEIEKTTKGKEKQQRLKIIEMIEKTNVKKVKQYLKKATAIKKENRQAFLKWLETIENLKNIKNLISEWDKPVDWETAKKLAQKHGFKTSD